MVKKYIMKATIPCVRIIPNKIIHFFHISKITRKKQQSRTRAWQNTLLRSTDILFSARDECSELFFRGSIDGIFRSLRLMALWIEEPQTGMSVLR